MLGGPWTYSLLIVTLSVWCQCVYGGSENQPKLMGRDGGFVLQAAKDKNITVRLQGSSVFMINEVDMLSTLRKRAQPKKPQSFHADVAHLPFQVQRLERAYRRLAVRVRIVENRNNSVAITRLVNLISRMGMAMRRYNQMAENLTDQCASNPCKNGGDCYGLFADFHCDCPDSWTGKTCETDVDECNTFNGTDLGCQNNATCVNSDGSYRCVCATGYSGIHCRERKSDCEKSAPGELCGKGTCIPANNDLGYSCICNSGWKTDNISQPCTVDVNECVEAHVMCHTSCINLPGTFTCGPCPSGYTGNGIKCQDIDECAVDNGGCSTFPRVQCINTEGSFHCGKCPPGWTGNGRLCMQVESNSCGPDNICHPQALCQYVSNTQVCQCPAGMTGSGYGPAGCTGISVDPCSDHQCKNGGTCVSRGTRHSCICPSGYRQPFCETRSACAQRPCLNGGMCVDDDSPSGFHCVCSRGASGPLCQQKQLSCGSVLRDRSGELTYPASGLYEPGKTCAWGIRTDFNLTLNVTFSRFELEEHPECGKDWLQINDGRSLATPLIGRFCGSNLPNGGNIVSSHNTLLLWFRSDNSTNFSGFSLKWNSITPICGGHQKLNDQAQGIIRSPGYPGKSPRGRDCEWSLEAPLGSRILLRFYEVEMNSKANCTRNQLIIYDSDEVLENICVTGTPAPIYTSSNVAKIYYHTSMFFEDSLFQVHYEVVAADPGCGGVHSEEKGKLRLTSDMKNCNFLIQLPPGTRISANVTKGEPVYGSPAIKIFDGKTDDDPLLAEFAGDAFPTRLLSSQNFVLISMSMNQSPIDLAGTVVYEVSYNLVCGEELRDPLGGTFTTPNYPKPYFSGLHCKYIISGPLDSVVHLNITDYDVSEFEDSCNDDTDFVEIFYDVNEPAKRHCKDVPMHIVSPKNHLRIDFHSNGNPQRRRGVSFSYSFEEIGCGGVLREPEGSFSASESTTQCEWILEAPESDVIALNLDYARSGTNCAPGDSDVQIFLNNTNTDEARLVQSMCGGEKQVRTVLFSNLATVFLRPLPSGLNTGLTYGIKANYTFTKRSTKCGGNITDLSGNIQSPGYPGNYVNSVDCTWVIHAPLGHKIELVPNLFALEPSSSQCLSDYLEIRNGMSEQSPLIGRFCGNSILPHIPSFTNHLYLRFHSDSSVSGAGFDIVFQQTSNGCGGSLSSHSGSIASPHYPEISSGPVQCDWKISVSSGSSIEVQVLRLSPTADFCSNNVLSVYDGADTLAKQLKMNCSQSNSSILLISTGNTIFVRYALLGNTTADGQQFYLSYTTNCRQTLDAMQGVIESPNFPSNYPDRLRCEWTIVGRRADKIVLTFSHFELETGDLTCAHDQFEVIDMKGEEILEKQNVCNAMETGDVLTSDGNKLVVKFTSDYSHSASGFRFEFKRNGCGGYETRPRGSLKTPNAPYSVDLDCEWLIETTPGMLIVLDISDKRMETDSADCATNGLIIKNSKDDEHYILKECQTEAMRMSVTAQGTTMYIRFYTDSKRSMKYMKAFYWTKAAQCGGIFRSHSGTIMSPNYPNNYNQPSLCEWMITTEDAFLMSLEFVTMDIPVAENCSQGFVEVYNGRKGEQSASLIRRFCESGTGISVKSTGHMVHVILNSNGGPPAKGFLMRFKKQCGFDLVQSSGLLKAYIQDQPCQWFYNPTDSEAKLSITILKLECHCDGTEADDCRRHRGLRIYDMASNSTEHSYCEKAPTEVTLTGSQMIAVSNVVSVVAKYSIGAATCGGVLASLRGAITSPYYPSVYPMNTECIWTIEAAAGNSIELTIDDMNLDSSDRCNRDYVEVREKAEHGNLLGAFCSNDTVARTFTVFDKIWIKFHSADTSFGVNSGGFKLSWTYAQLNELTGSKGRIEPPSTTMLRFEPEPFMWRISVPRDNVITLTFKEYNDGLQLYDGFDENALPIDIQVSPWEVTSSSNVVMMRTDNKIVENFRLDWQAQSKAAIKENTTISKCSETINIGIEGVVDLTSPGYPNGYENGLKCEWIAKADSPTRHAVVRLYDVRLENLVGCMADYLQVSTSHDLVDWHEEFRICDGPPKTMVPFRVVHGTPHLKLKFVTDLSVNGTGFKSTLLSYCGGNLTDPVGRIVGADVYEDLLNGNCTWQIRVRPGRRIKFTFDFVSIWAVNSSDRCFNYAIIREGITDDGPILPPGRICSFKDFNRTVVSNTNHVTVKFYMNPVFTNPFFRLEMKMWNVTYREYSVCGGEVRLTPYSRSVNFTSPNYPHVPNPHTECIWLIVAPPGESVKAEFVDQFSMNARRCDKEFVELRDGSTALARQLGKFCRRPATIRSSGNVLYLRYMTDIPEPRNGFKVNVSLSTCGGTFTQFNSILTSPNYPAPGGYPPNSVCDYVIKVNPYSRLNLTFLDLHLPFDSSNLNESDRIVIYQKSDSAPDELGDELAVIYGNTTAMPVVLVDNNMVLVRFHTFKANNMYRGFRVKYDRMYGFCFRDVSGENGVLSLYLPPNRRVSEHCRWQITVPKGRRVKADISNVMTATPGAALPPHFRITFYNDFQAVSRIAYADYSNVTTLPSVRSTDNQLYVNMLGLRPYSVRGLRLTYSSLEPSNCPDDITGDSGTLSLANVNRSQSFFCKSQVVLSGKETLSLNITSQEVQLLKGGLIQPCVRYQSRSLTESQYVLCANYTNKNVLIPVKRSSIMMHQNENVHLRKLEATFIKHQCGGEYMARFQLKFTLPRFESTYGRLDCAWVIFAGANSGYELTGTFDFKRPCSDEYVAVYAGSTSSSLEIIRFCNNGTVNSTQLTSASMYIEYRTSAYSAQSSLEMTIKKANVCGEKVVVDRTLQFTNSEYRNNQECVWDLEVREGFFLRLEFIGRFFIEDSKDCVKDYLEVRKLDGGAWVSVGRYCGRELPPSINTTSQHMQLIFRTDDTVTADGFTVVAIKTCDGIFNVTSTPQKIVYPPKWTMSMVRLSCNYTLLTDSEKYIKVKFNKMDIGYRQLCGLSQMRIRKQNSHQEMEELGPYCKSNELSVVKAKNYMSLAYVGQVETGVYEFEFSLETCGGEVSTPQWIESQQNDQGTGYSNHMNCVWNITAPADHNIVVQFKYLNMEMSEKCDMDYVVIYKGPLMREESSEKRMCGNQTQNPPIVHIDSNRAVVAAVSDYWVTHEGFMARIIFSKSCKERLTLTEANTPTELYREQVIGRDEVMYCDYRLMAPDGFRIKIDLEVIDLNPKNVTCQDDCDNCDYIEVMDSERSGRLRMTKVCRPLDETLSLMSSFKDAVIRAHLEQEGSHKYKLNLRLVEANCGGQVNFELKADSPVRITPALGRNKLYLPNVHCIWRISSDNNFDIRFENFSLQNASDVAGECLDYLQIKSKYYSRLTNRKYCGAVPSYVIKTTQFAGSPLIVEIIFHTDEAIESTGFTLTAAQTPSCNATYNSTAGLINGFFDTVCANSFAMPENYTVNIVLRPIYFPSPNCSINYIKVTDENSDKDVFRDCSYEQFGTRVLTATNRIRVEIRVTFPVRMELFYYGSPKALPPGCGGSLDMPQGYVASPNYGQFENATVCRWNITTVSPNRINLRFSEIHMGTKCRSNYLDIIEIDSNGVEKVAQHYCNREVDTSFVSTSNRLAFVTATTPDFDGTGWNLKFQISAPGESVFSVHEFE